MEQQLERLYRIAQIPMYLLEDGGQLLRCWPETSSVYLNPEAAMWAIADFRLQNRDETHPLITFFDPGFLLGILGLPGERYLLFGLVSPVAHTREEILNMGSGFLPAAHLQGFCDFLMQQRTVFLEQLKALICLGAKLLGCDVVEEDIRFVDNVAAKKLSATRLDQTVFQQREEPEFHVPVDFEQGICDAVQAGNQALLEQTLFSPRQGRAGRMSANDLRQEKYMFVCLATLSSRAAIRGGVEPETAFSLSDLYCQRSDVLMEIPQIQSLMFTMLTDFCGKVREAQGHPAVTPLIQSCLSYISVHLHESVTVADLSAHVGLCTRSLSLRFRKEVGVGIVEYIHQEKLREAEYLLRRTDYSLSEIAAFLNYPTQSYFTQIFRRYRGVTPQQFRERRA